MIVRGISKLKKFVAIGGWSEASRKIKVDSDLEYCNLAAHCHHAYDYKER